MTQLASRMSSLRQALAERRSRPWTKAPFTTTLVDLRAKVLDWEKGKLPESDYEFGLLHHHLDFMSKLVREIPTPIKPSSNLAEESLQECQDRLRDLSLVLSDVQTPITCWLEAKRILDEIFVLTKRPMSADRSEPVVVGLASKERSILGKIVDEIKVWNRKKLSAFEFHQLQDKLAKLKVYVSELDTKDPEWVQFTTKMEAYCWRQEARLKLESTEQNLSDDEIRELLHRSPREIVEAKGHEWVMLLQKSQNIEIMAPKQIEERIQTYLNQKLGISDWIGVCNFMANAKIGHQSEDLHRKLEVFEKAANARCFIDSVDLDSLQTLVEQMLERKLWSTSTFSLFDEVLKTARDLKEAALQSRQSVVAEVSSVGDEGTPLESLKQQLKTLRLKKDKLFVSRVEELVRQLDRLPGKVRDGLRDEVKNLEHELAKIAAFKEAKKRTLPALAVQICTQREPGSWKSLVWQVGDILAEYRSLQFRDQFVEEWFSVFDTLLTATWGLHNPVFGLPAWENMMNELKIMTSLIQQDTSDSSSESTKIQMFPEIVSELIELSKKIEIPISKAKEFVKIVNQIKYASAEEHQKLTLAEAKKLLANHKESKTPILMNDSEEFLEECITKMQTLEPLGSQELLSYQTLQEAVGVLENIGLKLDGNMSENLRSKLQKASAFKAKLTQASPQQLEQSFETLAEEYTALGIKIEQVETLLNSMQLDKDTLEQLKETEMTLDELQIHQLLQLREKLKKVVYFKSTFQDVLAKYYQALFTAVNDLITGRLAKKDPVNPSSFEMRIKFEDLCQMIEELSSFLGTLEIGARPLLLKLLDEAQHVQKEAAEFHASRRFPTNGAKSTQGEAYSHVLDMTTFIKDRESFKKVLAEPQARQPLIKGDPKNDKDLINRISGPIEPQNPTRTRSRERDRDTSNHSDRSDYDLEPFKHDLGASLLDNEGTLIPFSENRGYSVKKIKDVLWNSKIYDFPDHKEATHVAKCLEALASSSHIISGTSYTKTVEDLVKSLRDVMSFPYIVNHLKQSKFSLDSIQLIIGKNPSELKHLNQEIKQRPYTTAASAADGKPAKAAARHNRLSGLIDSLASRPAGSRSEQPAEVPAVLQPKPESRTGTFPLQSVPAATPVVGTPASRAAAVVRRAAPSEKQTAADLATKKPRPAGLLAGIEEFRHYRIFHGPLLVQQSENTATSYPEVQLVTAAASQAVVTRFCALPPIPTLGVKVSQQAFENYVRKCLQAPQKYCYLAGVVAPFPQDDGLQQMLREKQVVASVQYTPACKIFLLPSEFFSQEWSQAIELVVPADREVALYFLIVRKMVQGDESVPDDKKEAKITPEVVIGEKKMVRIRPNGVKQPIKLVQFEPEAPQVVPHDTLQEIQQNVPTREHLFLDYRIKHTNPPQSLQTGVIKVIHRQSQVLEVPTSYPKPNPPPPKQPVMPEPPTPVPEEAVPAVSKAEKISFVVKSINSIFSDPKSESKTKRPKMVEEIQNKDDRTSRHQEVETFREPVAVVADDKDLSSRLSGYLEQITGIKRKGEASSKPAKTSERGGPLAQMFKNTTEAPKSPRPAPIEVTPNRRTESPAWNSNALQRLTAKLSAEEVAADLLSVQKTSFDAGDFSALREAARSKPDELFGRKGPSRREGASVAPYSQSSFMSPGGAQPSSQGRAGEASRHADPRGEASGRSGRTAPADPQLGKRPAERGEPDFSAIQEAARLRSPLQVLQHWGLGLPEHQEPQPRSAWHAGRS